MTHHDGYYLIARFPLSLLPESRGDLISPRLSIACNFRPAHLMPTYAAASALVHDYLTRQVCAARANLAELDSRSGRAKAERRSKHLHLLACATQGLRLIR